MNNKLDFYHIDKDYIAYLQKGECSVRGKTFVPNMEYGERRQKFLCGIVFNEPTSGIDYFVAVSSFKIQKSENILISDLKDKLQVKGSLRFNFMLPVPEFAIKRLVIANEQDIQYKNLLMKELAFIRANEEEIVTKATEVYNKITGKICSRNLLDNSCDFKLLESLYSEYCQQILLKDEDFLDGCGSNSR